jgi:cyclase
MLKVRIIPTLLWRDFGLVKGVGFDSWRRVGPVLPAIKVYNSRDVDELILLDVTASKLASRLDVDSLHDYADFCFVPLTVGGGIQNLDQVKQVLCAGADKIALNTAAYLNPALVTDIANAFGSQCVTISIDAARTTCGQHECFSHAGSRATGQAPGSWARTMQDHGAGEILITSIDRDGSMSGYDLELVAQVAEAVSIPVIASGGAGCYEHMRQAVVDAGASAVAAASMFHFTEQTPAAARTALEEAGIPVRSVYAPSPRFGWGGTDAPKQKGHRAPNQ